MKKEFYIGQPLVVKGTGKKVIFAYDDGSTERPCKVLSNGDYFCHDYYDYKQLKPSTELKFSQIIAGLEQGYFEVGTKFRRLNTDGVLTVKQSFRALYLQGEEELPSLTTSHIHSTWVLVGDSK